MKKYKPMSQSVAIAYTVATAFYIILIGVLMTRISAWWFLALFVWHWRWNEREF